jgi:hypothetical protein
VYLDEQAERLKRWILKFGRDILSRDKRHKGFIVHYQSITADVIMLGRFGYLGELREGTLNTGTIYSTFWDIYRSLRKNVAKKLRHINANRKLQ